MTLEAGTRWLRDIAYSRSGDKANISNLTVIPIDPADFDYLLERLTADAVADRFAGLTTGAVTRYVLPKLPALNFVLEEALDSGVSTSLRLDPHGKSYQSILLDMRI
ncbi:AtuA-related protein [Rhodococcus koreensis]